MTTQVTPAKAGDGNAELTHALHVTRVPLKAWQRAKQNAIASNLAFRDYIIRLLAESEPFLGHPAQQIVDPT